MNFSEVATGKPAEGARGHFDRSQNVYTVK